MVGEESDLERGGPDNSDRDQRQRQLADHGAELTDGFADPQAAEVQVVPEAAAPGLGSVDGRLQSPRHPGRSDCVLSITGG